MVKYTDEKEFEIRRGKVTGCIIRSFGEGFDVEYEETGFSGKAIIKKDREDISEVNYDLYKFSAQCLNEEYAEEFRKLKKELHKPWIRPL